MKNALVPLLLIALAALGVFIYFSIQDNQRQIHELTAKLEASPKAPDINLEDKCAKRSREEFKDLGWEKEPMASFSNHYNAKMNRCFMLIQTTSVSGGNVVENRHLSDAFDRKELGEYMRSTADGKKFWKLILSSAM